MSRSDFLTAIRQNKILHMLFPPHDGQQDPLEIFARALTLNGGVWDDTFLHGAAPDNATLITHLRGQYAGNSVFCSATPEVNGDHILPAGMFPAWLKNVDVGVVRARFGVSENGWVFLSDEHLCVSALSTHAQHLVVLLDKRSLFERLHLAHKQTQYFNARYTLMIAGPAALADSENALMSGAKGVRSLRVVTF